MRILFDGKVLYSHSKAKVGVSKSLYALSNHKQNTY